MWSGSEGGAWEDGFGSATALCDGKALAPEGVEGAGSPLGAAERIELQLGWVARTEGVEEIAFACVGSVYV